MGTLNNNVVTLNTSYNYCILLTGSNNYVYCFQSSCTTFKLLAVHFVLLLYSYLFLSMDLDVANRNLVDWY